MKNWTLILRAIANVIERSSIYSETKGTVEVERLYLLEKGLEHFVQTMPLSLFEAKQKVEQEDCFFDIRLGDRWQLADTDHYIRIRVVRDQSGLFLKGEIKVGYPGPQSNPNARFSPAEKLTEDEVKIWQNYLEFLGLEIERRYKKHRIPFTAKRCYQGFDVELEADCFMDDLCNGKLAGRFFVSISVETEGSKREKAEKALLKIRKDIEHVGIILKECDGNYEDYFYGRKLLPK